MSDLESTEYYWDEPEKPVRNILRMAYTIRQNFIAKTSEITLEDRVMELENQMKEVTKQLQIKKMPTYNKGDYVYEMHRKDLEKKHMGEVVAIDMDEKKPIAFGRNVAEAYLKAKIVNPDQSQYYFRRIGKPYVEKL